MCTRHSQVQHIVFSASSSFFASSTAYMLPYQSQPCSHASERTTTHRLGAGAHVHEPRVVVAVGERVVLVAGDVDAVGGDGDVGLRAEGT